MTTIPDLRLLAKAHEHRGDDCGQLARAVLDVLPQELLHQALNALRANDQWHWDYDDHNGYAESELHEQNTAAIAALEQAVKP